MLISLDHLPGGQLNGADIEIDELLFVASVAAANVVKDIRENIRNLVGGRMIHYEKLIEEAVATALSELESKAKAKGYDGVIGVKISHPSLVEGGCEVVVYGNGFRKRLNTKVAD